MTVKASGPVTVTEDRDWLLEHVTQLTAVNEEGMAEPWVPGDAPDGYIEQQLKGIVGLTMEVDTLQGLYKLSQNHPDENRAV